MYVSKTVHMSITQSICTLISNLSGQLNIFLGSGTLKEKYIILRVWNFKIYKVASTLIFSGSGPYFFCLQFEIGLFSFRVTKKLRALLFTPYFLHPIFWTLFFQSRKPTHVFKSRIVGADWLGEWMVRDVKLFFFLIKLQLNLQPIWQYFYILLIFENLNATL